ncbi:MAG: hypothetical protein GXP62_00360 [Oligoflexia bacterium]|nr:hypothetical protein [Oligoflexia bacterium]
MTVPCPACHRPMLAETYAGHYGREVALDICHHCNAIWFDKLENLGLTAGGVLALIQSMQARYQQDRQPLPQTMPCPRCTGQLKPSKRRTNTIQYTVSACQKGHGHFITYFELLREKDCVRPLSGAKLRKLREQVSSVNCSNCGAPVDIQKTAACTHCGAPLALLDPDAMAQTLERLSAEHDRKSNPNGDTVAVDMALDRLRTKRTFTQLDQIDHSHQHGQGGWGLVGLALDALMRALR